MSQRLLTSAGLFFFSAAAFFYLANLFHFLHRGNEREAGRSVAASQQFYVFMTPLANCGGTEQLARHKRPSNCLNCYYQKSSSCTTAVAIWGPTTSALAYSPSWTSPELSLSHFTLSLSLVPPGPELRFSLLEMATAAAASILVIALP